MPSTSGSLVPPTCGRSGCSQNRVQATGGMPHARSVSVTDGTRLTTRGAATTNRQPYSASISSAYLAWMPRRFSFEVGVSSSESGSHSAWRIFTFFTRSALLNPAIASATPLVDLGDHVGVLGQLGERVELDAVVLGPHRCDLGVEHHERRHERLLVADGARLADERDHLQLGLEVGRADVLPAGGDDELLLAVDDPQVALVVEHADVAGVQGAVRIEGLGGLLRVVEVAEEHVAAPDAHLAVVGEEAVGAREGHADGARLHPRGLPRHGTGALGHAVDLRQRHADGAVPADELGGDRRGAGDGVLHGVEADQRPNAGEGGLVEELVGGVVLGGGGAEGAPLRDRDGGRDRLVELGLLLRVGAEGGLHAGVDLLPHPRHAEHDLRAHVARVGGDLARVRAVGDLVAAHHRQVVRGHALGDVGHRQVRHGPEPDRLHVEHAQVALGRPHHVAVA